MTASMRYPIILLLILFSARLSAQQVAVALDMMNVFYIGIDNPVTIAVSNTNCKDISIEAEGCNIIAGDMPCHYLIRVDKPGKVEINIFKKVKGSKLKVGSQEFRCQYIHDVIAQVAGKTHGEICINTFKAQTGITVTIDGFDYDVRFHVPSYVVTVIRNNEPIFEKKCIGESFDEEILMQFQKLRVGDKVSISEIKFFSDLNCTTLVNETIILTLIGC